MVCETNDCQSVRDDKCGVVLHIQVALLAVWLYLAYCLDQKEPKEGLKTKYKKFFILLLFQQLMDVETESMVALVLIKVFSAVKMEGKGKRVRTHNR